MTDRPDVDATPEEVQRDLDLTAGQLEELTAKGHITRVPVSVLSLRGTTGRHHGHGQVRTAYPPAEVAQLKGKLESGEVERPSGGC